MSDATSLDSPRSMPPDEGVGASAADTAAAAATTATANHTPAATAPATDAADDAPTPTDAAPTGTASFGTALDGLLAESDEIPHLMSTLSPAGGPHPDPDPEALLLLRHPRPRSPDRSRIGSSGARDHVTTQPPLYSSSYTAPVPGVSTMDFILAFLDVMNSIVEGHCTGVIAGEPDVLLQTAQRLIQGIPTPSGGAYNSTPREPFARTLAALGVSGGLLPSDGTRAAARGLLRDRIAWMRQNRPDTAVGEVEVSGVATPHDAWSRLNRRGKGRRPCPPVVVVRTPREWARRPDGTVRRARFFFSTHPSAQAPGLEGAFVLRNLGELSSSLSALYGAAVAPQPAPLPPMPMMGYPAPPMYGGAPPPMGVGLGAAAPGLFGVPPPQQPLPPPGMWGVGGVAQPPMGMPQQPPPQPQQPLPNPAVMRQTADRPIAVLDEVPAAPLPSAAPASLPPVLPGLLPGQFSMVGMAGIAGMPSMAPAEPPSKKRDKEKKKKKEKDKEKRKREAEEAVVGSAPVLVSLEDAMRQSVLKGAAPQGGVREPDPEDGRPSFSELLQSRKIRKQEAVPKDAGPEYFIVGAKPEQWKTARSKRPRLVPRTEKDLWSAPTHHAGEEVSPTAAAGGVVAAAGAKQANGGGVNGVVVPTAAAAAVPAGNGVVPKGRSPKRPLGGGGGVLPVRKVSNGVARLPSPVAVAAEASRTASPVAVAAEASPTTSLLEAVASPPLPPSRPPSPPGDHGTDVANGQASEWVTLPEASHSEPTPGNSLHPPYNGMSVSG